MHRVDLVGSDRVENHVHQENHRHRQVEIEELNVTVVAQETLKLSDLRSPPLREQGSLVDHREQHGDDERQAEAVEQVEDELLRIAGDLRISDFLERLPDVVAHDIQPEYAEKNGNVHHVARELAEPGDLHDQDVHSIEDQKCVQKNQTEYVAHQTLPVIGLELLQVPQNEQCDDQQRQRDRSA